MQTEEKSSQVLQKEFKESLIKMNFEGLDRVLLTVYEWDFNDKNNYFLKLKDSTSLEKSKIYYPFESLSDPEKKLVLNKKDYYSIYLVLGNKGKIICPDDGIGINERMYSPICKNYFTRKKFIDQKDLEEAGEYFTRFGWNGDKICSIVCSAILNK